MIVLLLACTQQVFAPEYADCTKVTTGDELADGSIEVTQSQVFDAEGRVTLATTERDDYHLEVRNTYEGDCLVHAVQLTTYAQGDTYEQETEQACDDAGDPVTQHVVVRSTGSQNYSFTQSATWERTYGENGLVATAFRVDTYDERFHTETLESYDYDAEDRLVRYLGEGESDSALRTWVYAPEGEDLVEAIETRNGFGVLTEATYHTFDERGRTLETRLLDADRAETVYTRTWEDKRRWADTSLDVQLPEGEGYEAAITCNDDRPWTERVLEYDGWSDARDGRVDYLQVETVTCD